MKNSITVIVLFFLFVSCSNTDRSNNYDSEYDADVEIQIDDVVDNDDAQRYFDQTGEYPDGTYCAEVEYYNPSTGTRNTYNLNVDVEGGELIVIHWSNGGWLDENHFFPVDITDGECEFTSDRGYIYTITLEDFGGCGYTDEHKIRQDVNDEVEQTTCLECGAEKDPYDDYCDDCKQETEQTCSICGGYKSSIFDEYCDSCKEGLEKEEN